MKEFKFKKSFVEQLFDLLDGGVILIDAISIISKSFNGDNKKRILMLKKDLEKGIPLYQAFSNISTDKSFLMFIKTAEKTGDITTSFKYLKEKYKFIEKIRNEILGIIVYPIIVIVLSIVILIILLSVVVPKFVDIYKDLNKELPKITLIIISISNIILKYKHIIFLIFFMLFSILFILKKIDYHIYDSLIIKIPLYKEYLILTFTQNMYIALSSNVDFLDAFKLCLNVDNILLKKELSSIYKRIEKGDYISSAFFKSNFFNQEYKSYINIADNTGNLKYSFNNLYEILNKRFVNKINVYLKFFEPISIIFIAFIVGIIVFSIMLPLFSLADSI